MNMTSFNVIIMGVDIMVKGVNAQLHTLTVKMKEHLIFIFWAI